MANPIEIIKQSEAAIDKLNAKLLQMDQALERISQSAAKIPKNLTGGKSANSSQQKEINNLLKERQKIQKLIDEGNKKSAQIEVDREKTAQKIAKAEKKRINERLKQQKLESDSRKSLAAQKKSSIAANIKETQTIQSNREALERQKRTMIAFNRPYNVLIRNHKKAKQAVQDATVKFGKNSQQVKQATKVYKKYQKQLNTVNKATQNFANKGLRGVIGSFKSFIGAFGVTGGAIMLANFIKSVFDTIKALDRLEFTLKAVSKTEGDIARSTAFLTRLSLQFGAELISTTDRYVKFSVASRNAGLSAKETEKIFETVTKASAVLGLKTDELTGIYLALEQMLSKGKVTTEELRRQLGERLPGAFDLAAKALGKTTAELDKMLRDGEVLASDLLPKLRVEIDKAFGLENLDSVNTLQTATTKLTTSFQLFIDALNKTTMVGKAAQVALEILGFTIMQITNGILGIEKVAENKRFAEYYKTLEDNINKVNDATKIQEFLTNNRIILMNKILTLENKLSIEQNKLSASEKDRIREKIGILMGELQAGDAAIKLIEGKTKAETKQKKELINKIEIMKIDNKISKDRVNLEDMQKMSLKELRTLYTDLQKPLEGTVSYYRDLIKANLDQIELLDDQTEIKKLQDANVELQKKLDLLLNVTEETKKGKEAELQAAVGSIAYYQEQISLLEETRNKLSLTADEYMRIGLEIDKFREKIDEIVNYIDATDILNDLLDAQELEQTDKELKELFDNTIKKGIQGLSELTRESTEDLNAEMLRLYGEDYQAYLKFAKMKTDAHKDEQKEIFDLSQQLFNELTALGSARFDRNIQEIDDEINRNKDKYSQILDNENLTEEQRSQIEAERNRKERELEKKKREEQRKKAQFEKQTAIAQTIINTAQAISKTLTERPLPGGAPFVALTAAIGLAQLGTIISTPIPQYEKGKGDYDNYEGMAVWGEKRREVKISKDGTLELSPKKIDNHMTYVKKDDVIHPDANKFLSTLNQDSYDEQTYNYVQSSTVDSSVLGNFMMAKLDAQTNQMVSAIKNKKMSFKINQTLNVGEDLEFLNRQNNTL